MMTTPCPISSSFPPDHDPLCDLPIHDVESPVLVIRKNNISGFGFPKIDLMDDILTSQVLKHEADRDERQQNSKTLYDASDIFPNYKGNRSEVQQRMLATRTFSILPPPPPPPPPPPQSLPVTADAGMRQVVGGAGQKEVDGSKSIAAAVVGSVFPPYRHDILFGRGRKVMEHPGNLRLLMLVKEKMPIYDAANKEAKTRLTAEVVQTLKGPRSSRFLKKNATGVWWEEVTDALARKKVSHAFRTMRQSVVKSQEKQTTQAQGAANVRLHQLASVVQEDSKGK